MTMFHTDEVSFEVPEGWVDRTINILAPPEHPSGFTLVMSRQALHGKELAPFVAGALATLAKEWPRFVVLGQRDRKVGPLQGREARVKWAPKGQPFYQHQVYVAYYGTALIFTATTAFRFALQCEGFLDQAMANVRFRRQ
jgi:hypothetical protein